jgi:SAM-dependent methyltransferase
VSLYQADLAHIHDAGFGELAARSAPEVLNVLRAHGIRPSRSLRPRVVEIGCGSGILASRLVEAGYDVMGIDVSPAMIRLARAKAPGARFRVASLVDARLPRASAVVAIGETVSYVPGGIRTLRAFFTRVRRALVPDGVFVFDFIESAERRTFEGRSLAGADWALVASATASRSGRTLTRRMVTFRKSGGAYRRSQETHRVRIYSRDGIARALAAAGFQFTMRRSIGRYRLMTGDVAVIATGD